MNEEEWSALSHELRTPLTAIVAAASSIQAEPDLDRATHDELIRVILECARRLDEVIGRVETGPADGG